MGYLNSERPPEKWSNSWFKLFVERLRTAVNNLSESNFPNAVSGTIIKNGTLSLKAAPLFEIQVPVLALAAPISITSLAASPSILGGYIYSNPMWKATGCTCMLEVTGASGDTSTTFTLEIHGTDGKLCEVVLTAGAAEWKRSASFQTPTTGQTLVLKAYTSNAAKPGTIVSAKLIVSA